MQTAAEKRRVKWLLILIFFFFANLILVTVLLFNSLFPQQPSATAPASQAATQAG